MTTLDESYARCRALTKAYGANYYASTFLLPRVKRPHVHALYGFCRYADQAAAGRDGAPADEQARALAEFADRFFTDLERGDSDDEILKAVVFTANAFDMNRDCFRRFLRSRTRDLTVETYDTFEDLLDYMDGSAAVIGELMLPILEPTSGAVLRHARDLAIAFQLTDFLRDVPGDLDRGRVYLPQEDLGRFGADPHLRRATPQWQALMRFEIGRTREYYASGELGSRCCPPRPPVASEPPGPSTRRPSTASRPPTATCSNPGPGFRPPAKRSSWDAASSASRTAERTAGDTRRRATRAPCLTARRER